MEQLELVYEGVGLRRGTEVSDLRLVLEGFNRLVLDAARLLNGEKAEVHVRILQVKSNSLDIQSAIEILVGLQPAFLAAKDLFSAVRTAGEMIKAWLDIQSHLKGKTPFENLRVDGGNAVQLTNHQGDVLIVNGNVYGAFNTLEVSKSAQRLATPFRRGARSLNVIDNGRQIASYSSKDAEYFVSLPAQ